MALKDNKNKFFIYFFFVERNFRVGVINVKTNIFENKN